MAVTFTGKRRIARTNKNAYEADERQRSQHRKRNF